MTTEMNLAKSVRIKPHGQGGLSVRPNLLTLCHTCHSGLEPHFDPQLFNFTEAAGELAATGGRSPSEQHLEELRVYRKVMKRRLKSARSAKNEQKDGGEI